MGFRHAAAERRPFSCNLFDMRRAGIATLVLLSLAGCETATGIRPPGRGIAEISDADSRSSAANIESLTDVIKRNPSSAEAYNTRGAAYARAGNFSDAVNDFSQAINLDPNSAAATIRR
jgi:tetratricopeptide (TPR) repeat protein